MPQTQQHPQIVNPIQVQKFLKGVDYPIGRRDLEEHAQREGADQNVMYTLQQLPDMDYNSPNDVAQAIGDLT